MRKYFRLHWDGNLEPTIVKGATIEEAFNRNFSSGAMRILDYYEEIKELPKEEKHIVYRDRGESEYSPVHNEGFKEMIKEDLLAGKKTVSFGLGRYISKYSVRETGTEFRLTRLPDPEQF